MSGTGDWGEAAIARTATQRTLCPDIPFAQRSPIATAPAIPMTATSRRSALGGHAVEERHLDEREQDHPGGDGAHFAGRMPCGRSCLKDRHNPADPCRRLSSPPPPGHGAALAVEPGRRGRDRGTARRPSRGRGRRRTAGSSARAAGRARCGTRPGRRPCSSTPTMLPIRTPLTTITSFTPSRCRRPSPAAGCSKKLVRLQHRAQHRVQHRRPQVRAPSPRPR